MSNVDLCIFQLMIYNGFLLKSKTIVVVFFMGITQ
jgi:hypothetical protein